jgi:DNA-binding transcriptional ArsR family regulator
VEAGVFRALPDPPTREELLRLLGAHARAGSVRAIELLLHFQPGDTPGDLADLAELGARRATESPRRGAARGTTL